MFSVYNDFVNNKVYIMNYNGDIIDGGYEYETDGLIFLPMFLPVRGSDVGEKVQSYNGTWNYNYKCFALCWIA